MDGKPSNVAPEMLKPSLVMQLFPRRKLTQRSDDIMKVINGLHASVKPDSTPEAVEGATVSVLDEIADYEAGEATKDYGLWAPLHMSALRSMALDAGGRYAESYEQDKRTLAIAEHADDDDDRAI